MLHFSRYAYVIASDGLELLSYRGSNSSKKIRVISCKSFIKFYIQSKKMSINGKFEFVSDELLDINV